MSEYHDTELWDKALLLEASGHIPAPVIYKNLMQEKEIQSLNAQLQQKDKVIDGFQSEIIKNGKWIKKLIKRKADLACVSKDNKRKKDRYRRALWKLCERHRDYRREIESLQRENQELRETLKMKGMADIADKVFERKPHFPETERELKSRLQSAIEVIREKLIEVGRPIGSDYVSFKCKECGAYVEYDVRRKPYPTLKHTKDCKIAAILKDTP